MAFLKATMTDLPGFNPPNGFEEFIALNVPNLQYRVENIDNDQKRLVDAAVDDIADYYEEYGEQDSYKQLRFKVNILNHLLNGVVFDKKVIYDPEDEQEFKEYTNIEEPRREIKRVEKPEPLHNRQAPTRVKPHLTDFAPPIRGFEELLEKARPNFDDYSYKALERSLEQYRSYSRLAKEKGIGPEERLKREERVKKEVREIREYLERIAANPPLQKNYFPKYPVVNTIKPKVVRPPRNVERLQGEFFQELNNLRQRGLTNAQIEQFVRTREQRRAMINELRELDYSDDEINQRLRREGFQPLF